MELRDFIVTPILLPLVYLFAYWVRPRVTNLQTRRYFIPGLTVKIIGAISVGLIYQFYYDGGDTFNFHTRGSRHIWEAFWHSPVLGLKLLIANGEYLPETFSYATKIPFYQDQSAYFIIRISSILDFFTFSTYSATAVLFALLSFSGAWALYTLFYKRFSKIHFKLAVAILFVPSVFFWGSGILKDTVTIAALGWAAYSFDQLMFKGKFKLKNLIVFSISFFLIFSIKKYILLCFLPAIIIWAYLENINKIKSLVARLIIAPFIFVSIIPFAFWSVVMVGENDSKYAIENIAKTSQITAYDIAYWTGRNAGSTYSLGELDGTYNSMIQLLPSAINVSLFRPYLWEVSNPLMLLSALESLFVMLLTLTTLWKIIFTRNFRNLAHPIVLFCLTFSLIFAFAVGVSTFNFGTLMRYKIPLIPFFLAALFILPYFSKSERKLSEFEDTEK